MSLLRQPMMPSPVVFPNDLIIDVLSFLMVKPLMRLRCVSKSWNTLISDPAFVKLHLKRSTRNAHLTLVTEHFTSFPIRRLIDNPCFTLTIDPYSLSKDKNIDPYYLPKGSSRIVGFCNGLICLVGNSYMDAYREYWLHFWNPSTRTTSEKLGYFCDFVNNPSEPEPFRFAFGYDNSTDTYKVVA